MELITNFMLLFTESAPYLLVGLLLAGIIQFIIPARWIDTTLGEHSSVVTAALIGTPLPLCSCSVIPAAMGIRRAGASKASTASFMVATPETGVDSIGVTLALMGPAMAVFRPIAAIFSAIMAGKMVRWWDVETPPRQETTQKSCCSATKSPQKQSYWNMVKAIFQYGYGKLLADFMTWLLIGISFAALIQTYVPQTFLAAYGNGIPAMILVVLISTPMYICATASTPVAAGLMLSGISPGAALVFMLTGPATNIATLMVVKNELGIRSLYAYLTGVVMSALIMGITLDGLLVYFDITINVSQGQHGDMTSLIFSAAGIVLAGLIIWQYIKQIRSGIFSNNSSGMGVKIS